MYIQANTVNTTNNINKNIVPENKQEQITHSAGNSTYLPATFAAGKSQINTNTPVSYTKLFEIEIPGLKDKASVFRLANGQKVIVCPKKGPTVVKTSYNVGSMNEPEHLRGMSHYIEHNLFNGSKNLAPREYDSRVADLGGGTNASTSYAKTDYFLNLQLLEDNSLEEAIRLNALQTQFPTFPIDQLEKEKEPVKSEIDMYQDCADDVARNIVLKNLFNIPTNITDLIAGNKENINSFTKETVMDYYNTWYTPDNAVTVITGDIDVNETMQLVSKYYNKKPDNSKVNQRYSVPLTPTNKSVRNDIIMPNTTSPSINLGFAIPQGTSKEDMDRIGLLVDILESSDSRLSKALDKYGISPGFYTEVMQNTPDGTKALMASFTPTEEQLEDVLKIIYEELSYIANFPPSQTELNNVKQKQLTALKSLSESSSSLNCKLTDMAIDNDFNYFNTKAAAINNCTPQDISEIARKFLDLNKASICVSHSKDVNMQEINRKYYKSVQSMPQRTISFGASSYKPKESIEAETAKIRQYRLWNNIETMAISGNNIPTQSFSIKFKTDEINSTSSPAFMVLNEILDRGTLYKNNDAYNSLLNSKNMGISISASVDGLSGAAVFNGENLNDALSLFMEKINAPSFTLEEFERAKQLIKDSILSEPISADFELNHELFPALGKYKSKEERLKELDALTLYDIQALYSKILSTSEVSATITAPFEEKPEVIDIFNYELSRGFQPFRPCSINRGNSFNIYTPNTSPKIIAVADEKSQADIVQAYKYKLPAKKNVKDTAQIEILGIILGCGMSSRLFVDLRENEKLAYRVGAHSSSEKDTGIMELSIGTTTDSPNPKEGSPMNATKAIEGFNRNVNLLKTQNVTEKELQNAKTLYKTEILNLLETNVGKTAAYSISQSSSYNIEYFSKLLEAIDNITADDIRAAANYVFENPPITAITASQKTLDALNLH